MSKLSPNVDGDPDCPNSFRRSTDIPIYNPKFYRTWAEVPIFKALSANLDRESDLFPDIFRTLTEILLLLSLVVDVQCVDTPFVRAVVAVVVFYPPADG